MFSVKLAAVLGKHCCEDGYLQPRRWQLQDRQAEPAIVCRKPPWPPHHTATREIVVWRLPAVKVSIFLFSPTKYHRWNIWIIWQSERQPLTLHHSVAVCSFVLKRSDDTMLDLQLHIQTWFISASITQPRPELTKCELWAEGCADADSQTVWRFALKLEMKPCIC